MGGSLAFVAAARAGWMIGRDKNQRDRRLMVPAKMNLAPDSTGLAYSVVSSDISNVPRVEWESVPVTMSADEVLAMETDDEEGQSALDEAEAFLDQVLEDGPVSSLEVQRGAKEMGISEKTLRRAKKKLGVQSRRGGYGREGRWEFYLPEVKGGQPTS